MLTEITSILTTIGSVTILLVLVLLVGAIVQERYSNNKKLNK